MHPWRQFGTLSRRANISERRYVSDAPRRARFHGLGSGTKFAESNDVARMHELMAKYRDLPMDLADAALVAVAERERLRRVLTLDRRGFSVYRPSTIGSLRDHPDGVTRCVARPWGAPRWLAKLE